MRIVVTGATGNLGTATLRALREDDRVEQIVGVMRRRPDDDVDKVRWVPADLAEDPLDEVIDGADAVIHLAWRFHPTRDPVSTWRSNVLGALRLFEAIAEHRIPRLVHISSVGAYSPGSDDQPVDEQWPTHALPTAAYGREKSYLERVLDGFEPRNPDVRVVRIRPAFVFQRRAAASQRRVFGGPLVPGSLVRRGVVPVVPDVPGLRFQAVHADDVGDALRRAALDEAAAGAFNLAADPPIDPDVLAEIFDARKVPVGGRILESAVAAAWHARLTPATPGLTRLARSLPLMDSSRARQVLGWQPQHSAIDAIEAFLSGLNDAAGADTPPLRSRGGGTMRWREFASGVGGRDLGDDP